MRRVASLSGGVALVAGVLLVAPVSAAPERFSDTQTIMLCEELTADGGSAVLIMGESEQFGTFADAGFWSPGATPPTDEPAWIAMDAEVDFDGTSATATILMVEFVLSDGGPPFGDPVGDATVEAGLTPDGAPEPYRIQEHEGKQLFRREGTVQSYTVEGTLTMPNGVTFDLSSCQAATDTFTQFSNMPASPVSRFSSFDLNCGWETENGFVAVFATANEFESFTEVFVADGEDTYFGVPSAPFTLTTEAFAAEYEIFSADDGGDPLGSASASATLIPGDRINERFSFGNVKTHVIGQGYLVEGSLSLTLDGTTIELVMDETSCFAADVTTIDHQTKGRGGGRPLANDLPENAEPIDIGETVTVRSTSGTDLEPEAPCVLSDGGEDFELPIGHTAWWSFIGTGSPVTVDTTGSSFDTVAGVYVDDGGTLTQVGCNDDFESLAAQLTIDTEAGVTYYVQVGGFGGESGSLVLTIN
jgi:hypothetical protein